MATATERLGRTWESHFPLTTALATVDHKRIGRRYLLTTSVFFLIGGIEALWMRTQLGQADNSVLGPERYNQLFTMHGTTMIFLVVMPMLTGAFGNYLVPLMIGARDMAFPRLNAFSYWVFLLSGLFMYFSFIVGNAPNGGWFNYVPLTGPTYTPGVNIDYWALGLIFLGISTTVGAVNFIVTTLTMRAPGMSINRMPLFVWSILATAFAVVFALPALTLDAALLEFDRLFGTRFFDASAGGSPLLWQHLFWVFGHPDVYIMFLPAVGIISTLIATFSRHRVVGYIWLVLATIAIGFLGFGVWVHHMFATGLPILPISFFSAASLAIVIPSGIQIFGWIATLWQGRVWPQPPLLFALGFVVVFVMGGVTGVMVASVPLDLQVHDSYFVVAHFHYVLVGSAMFAILGGIYYWMPKFTGHMMHPFAGHMSFWLVFVGFNVTFFPMHILGLLGMPRRVYTYGSDTGWEGLNLLISIGAYVLAAGLLIFAIDVLAALFRPKDAPNDPWEANTLEWATSSPPPGYNFAEIPAVRSESPLWDEQPPRAEGSAGQYLEDVHGGRREALETTALDADPSGVLTMPPDSFAPLALALSLLVIFVGLLSTLAAVTVVGILLSLAAVAYWFWTAPEPPEPEEPGASGQAQEGQA